MYNVLTGEMWELKKLSSRNTTSAAISQLTGYVTGVLKEYPSLSFFFPYTTKIDPGWGLVCIGDELYYFMYWDEGNGILRYQYEKYSLKRAVEAASTVVSTVVLEYGVEAAIGVTAGVSVGFAIFSFGGGGDMKPLFTYNFH